METVFERGLRTDFQLAEELWLLVCKMGIIKQSEAAEQGWVFGWLKWPCHLKVKVMSYLQLHFQK